MPTVLKPPSTWRISPVMPAARSEHRKAAALPTSSRVTLRRRGATSATRLSILRNPGMPAAARVLIGPAEIALTRTPRAEIGQREQRSAAARHQGVRPLRQCGQAVARHFMRYAEALAGRGLQERPGESLARRVRYRVHEDIELTPFAPEQLEGDIALGIDRDVERHGEARSKRMRERLDAPFHLVVDVGEGELGSLPVHRLRDAPRDR